MAHEVETMFYYGDRPWHGLGTEVLECLTSEDAIKKAGLDWEVEKLPIFISRTKGMEGDVATVDLIRVVDHFAVTRMTDHKPLGVVGSKYTPLQNRQAFTFFDSVVGSKEAIYETAGSLRGGKIIWLLSKLPGQIGSAEDPIDKYLVLTNSHDGSFLIRMLVSPLRVVCMNTLSAAIGRAQMMYEIMHTASVLDKVQDVRDALAKVSDYFDQLNKMIVVLKEKRMSEKEIQRYVHVLFPAKVKVEKVVEEVSDVMNIEYGKRIKKHIEKILELVETGKGTEIAGVKGTAYGVWNAAIEWADHHATIRNKENPLEKRLDSIWFGTAARFKQKAFSEIVDYAQAA